MDFALFNEQNKAFLRTPSKRRTKRIFEIDMLRFLLIVLMVLDHLAYDFGYFVANYFNLSNAPERIYQFHLWAKAYWDEAWRINLRYGVIALFFMLLGLSSTLSRNSLKRGFIIFGFSCLLSIVTFYLSLIFKTQLYIIFGVISGLGLSLIIYSLIKLLFLKLIPAHTWKWYALFLGVVILITGYYFRYQTSLEVISKENFWMMFHGRFSKYGQTFSYVDGVFTPIQYSLKEKGQIIIGSLWAGADWGALFPYMGYAFLGAFFGELLYQDKRSVLFSKDEKHFLEKVFAPFTYIGSKTIYIYLLHQVVIGGVVFLLLYFLGVPLK